MSANPADRRILGDNRNDLTRWHDNPHEGGMVPWLGSCMGAAGERDGDRIEQQVVVTDAGGEMLTRYPYEESLLD